MVPLAFGGRFSVFIFILAARGIFVAQGIVQPDSGNSILWNDLDRNSGTDNGKNLSKPINSYRA